MDIEAGEVKYLPDLAPDAADVTNLFERGAIQNRNAFVRAIRDVEETLRRIGRQPNTEGGAGPLRFPFDEALLQEFALQRERLHAVVGAIGHIDDAVIGNLDAVRRVELLRPGAGGLARLGGLVVGFGAIGAPVALIRSGLGVEHDDPAVAISVGNKHLVGLVIDGDAGGPAGIRGGASTLSYAPSVDLQQ